ncbi:MAG: hypothetical protein ABIO70_05045 [Pseudomonadota bacterium]
MAIPRWYVLAALGGLTAVACDGPGPAWNPGTSNDTGDTTAPVPIGLWVWDADLPGDEAATADLLSFSDEHGVSTLFLACDPVGYGLEGAEARTTSFVAEAHAAGLQVLGMSGYSWFTVPCDAQLPGQDTCWTEGWAVYEACTASAVGFDGIMDDSEPASTPDGSFSTDYEQRAAWHVAYLEGIRGRIGDLPLHHAIPAWYDELDPISMDGGATTATLDAWIAGVVDVVGVMAYRDTAPEILALAATELGRGPAWIGVETGPTDEGETVSFYDDGAAALASALEELADEVGGDPHLAGLMVDDYAHWRGLGAR